MYRYISILILMLLMLFGGLTAQQPTLPDSSQQPTLPGVPDDGRGIPSDMQKRMEKKRNEQRQADLKRDTEKLVKLSLELKQYVDKTNENVLSLDVLKKAEEIEKLAHSVRTKMRGTEYGGN